MTGKELIKHLKTFHNNDDPIAWDIWMPEDVKTHARDLGFNLTEEECETVIEAMDSCKDASIGLNWDVMETHIDGILHARELESNEEEEESE